MAAPDELTGRWRAETSPSTMGLTWSHPPYPAQRPPWERSSLDFSRLLPGTRSRRRCPQEDVVAKRDENREAVVGEIREKKERLDERLKRIESDISLLN